MLKAVDDDRKVAVMAAVPNRYDMVPLVMKVGVK